MESGGSAHQHHYHDYMTHQVPSAPFTNWSNSLGIPLLGSPQFQSNAHLEPVPYQQSLVQNPHYHQTLQQPTWQLDHAPSWQPHPLDSATSFQSSLLLGAPKSPAAQVPQPDAKNVTSSSSSHSPRIITAEQSPLVPSILPQRPSSTSQNTFLNTLPISGTLSSPNVPSASLLSPSTATSTLPRHHRSLDESSTTAEGSGNSNIRSDPRDNPVVHDAHAGNRAGISTFGAGASSEFGFLDLLGSPLVHDDQGLVEEDDDGFTGASSGAVHSLAAASNSALMHEQHHENDDDDEDEDEGASGSEEDEDDDDDASGSEVTSNARQTGQAFADPHLVGAAVRAAGSAYSNGNNTHQGDRSCSASAVNSPVYSSHLAAGPHSALASGAAKPGYPFHGPAPAYAFSPQHMSQHPSLIAHRHYEADSAASSSTRSQIGGYFDEDDPSLPLSRCGTSYGLARGVDDNTTPPTSNSSDHGTGTTHNSPYPAEQLSGAPSQFLYNPPCGSVNASSSSSSTPSATASNLPAHVKLEDVEDHSSPHASGNGDPVFIPALSHPRSAHLSAAYGTQDRETDAILRAADPDFDLSASGTGIGGSSSSSTASGRASRKRKRSTTADQQYESGLNAEDLVAGGGSAAKRTHSTDRKYSVHEQTAALRDLSASASSSSSGKGKGTATATATGTSGVGTVPTATKKKKKKPVNSNLGGSSLLVNSNGTLRKRTEIPAVEDDPSVKPYGCNYPSCPSLLAHQNAVAAAAAAAAAAADSETGAVEMDQAPLPTISWRTVRELREHCAEHKRDGLEGGPLPFRCALDPCGKTFKSLAGLRFHFQNASANGHFFVSYEEGGAQPLKKFKACVQPTERSEKCPVPGCTKAFKQAAGLAYHLAHTEGHHMTEREVQTFAATLQSKTRWWYAKLGRQLL